MPLAETGRVWSAVHHNIKYRSRQYLHQLALRLFGLEVQAAKNAARRPAVVILDKRQRNACLGIAIRMPGLEKKPSLVAMDCGGDQVDTRKRGRFNLHRRQARHRSL